MLETAWFQHSKLKCDIPVSTFAFTFDLCRYNEEARLDGGGGSGSGITPTTAGR